MDLGGHNSVHGTFEINIYFAIQIVLLVQYTLFLFKGTEIVQSGPAKPGFGPNYSFYRGHDRFRKKCFALSHFAACYYTKGGPLHQQPPHCWEPISGSLTPGSYCGPTVPESSF